VGGGSHQTKQRRGGVGGNLTEDGILVQIEVTFAQVDFVTTPRRACAGSGKKKKKQREGKGGVCKRAPVTSLAEDTHTRSRHRGSSRALETADHALAQRFERAPRIRTDGP
jgi:hypothetical protein